MYVEGMAALVPRASLVDWPDGPATVLDKPDLTLLDRSLRRGLSDLTRMFMHVALGALRDADALSTHPRVIFGSAFGEIATAEAMLAQAFDDNSASPVRFRQSVHNTAEGLYSISTHNREPATAIAAGWDTVAMALIEAHGQLVAGAPRILLVLAEESVPEAFGNDHPHCALAAAFVLSAQETPRTRAWLGPVQRRQRVGLADPFGAENHPLGPAVCLAHAIESGRAETIVLSDGGQPYCVRSEPRIRS